MTTVTNSDESRIEVKRRIEATCIEDGYGLLVCRTSGERRLGEFDVAEAMRHEAYPSGGKFSCAARKRFNATTSPCPR